MHRSGKKFEGYSRKDNDYKVALIREHSMLNAVGTEDYKS